MNRFIKFQSIGIECGMADTQDTANTLSMADIPNTVVTTSTIATAMTTGHMAVMVAMNHIVVVAARLNGKSSYGKGTLWQISLCQKDAMANSLYG